MFMLNLLFKFDPNNANGIFESTPNPGGFPLQNSKHWLKLPAPNAPGNFDPENAAWTDLGPAGTLLIPSQNQQHDIAIRLAANVANFDANATAELVVAFGRPVVAQQPFGSPFSKNGRLQTLFHYSLPARPPGPSTGWFVNIGSVDGTRLPNNVNVTHRYEFAVGFNVKSGATTLSFGEDPEFDIGL